MLSASDLKKIAQDFSFIFCGVLGLFIVLNMLLWSAFWFRDTYLGAASFQFMPFELQSREKDIPMGRVYPGMKDREIRDLRREMEGLPLMHEAYTQVKNRPKTGKYYNNHKAGFRYSVDQSAWPPDRRFPVVYLFGNSTVNGFRVADWQTIASALTPLLRNSKRYANAQIYNFGRGGYELAQQRILFEQLIAGGNPPDLAIFINGLQAFEVLQRPPYEKMLADLLDKSIAETPPKTSMTIKQLTLQFYRWLPISRFIFWIQVRLFGEAHPARQPGLGEPRRTAPAEPAQDKAAWRRQVNRSIEKYFMFRKMATAVGAAYNVRTVFVWQPVPSYKYDISRHLFGSYDFYNGHREGRAYAIMESVVRANRPAGEFIWCADIQQGIDRPLYVDTVHYGPELSALVANCIWDGMN